MLLPAYRSIAGLSTPVLRGLLARRAQQGKEDAARLGEREGKTARPRPAGTLLWVHGASVGETLSALPLIRRLIADLPDLSILVTSGTVTSADLLARRLPQGAFHQYVPIDHPAWVRRFLDHWRPDLALWIESDLWPTLVSETQRRGVPMVLLNGRLSERSFRNWRWGRSLVRDLLAGFSLRLAQTEADRRRFAALRAGPVHCLGNLKFAAPPLPADDDALAALRKQIGSRPVWLAASTHQGEEGHVADAHLYARTQETELEPLPDLLTIIVPRHASRGGEIARLMGERGLNAAVRSREEPITPDTDTYIADTMGELGLFYRLTEVVFIGGSLVPHGGHNPIEAALLDCAILHGPHMYNFSEVAEGLRAAGGAREVRNHGELTVAVAELLSDDTHRHEQMRAAQRAASAETDVLDRVMTALAPYLPNPDKEAGRARA